MVDIECVMDHEFVDLQRNFVSPRKPMSPNGLGCTLYISPCLCAERAVCYRDERWGREEGGG